MLCIVFKESVSVCKYSRGNMYLCCYCWQTKIVPVLNNDCNINDTLGGKSSFTHVSCSWYFVGITSVSVKTKTSQDSNDALVWILSGLLCTQFLFPKVSFESFYLFWDVALIRTPSIQSLWQDWCDYPSVFTSNGASLARVFFVSMVAPCAINDDIGSTKSIK